MSEKMSEECQTECPKIPDGRINAKKMLEKMSKICQQICQEKCHKEMSQKMFKKMSERKQWSPLDFNPAKERGGENNFDEIDRWKDSRFHRRFSLLLVLTRFYDKQCQNDTGHKADMM